MSTTAPSVNTSSRPTATASTTYDRDVAGAAGAYLARGWRPVPVPAGHKGPIFGGWQRADFGPEMFGAGDNIGIVLGAPSGGLVDVDLDCPEARELADRYLPTTVATGRAGSPRSHRWYICPGATTRQFRDPVDKSMVLEIRSTGVQTLVGPSIHPEDGDLYDTLEGQPVEIRADQLLALVEAIYRAVLERRGRAEAPSPTPVPEVLGPPPAVSDELAQRRATRYLDEMPAAISGSGGHAATYAAATVLTHGFGLSEAAALRMLMERYNPRCVPQWSVRELQHKVRDATTKPHRSPYGYLLTERRNDDVDLSNFKLDGGVSAVEVEDGDEDDETDAADRAAEAAATADPGPFPERLLEVPGFLGDMIDWNLATAFKPQPVLALAGAIALQSVLAARKIRDERGNRTNLYLLGLAESGRGKEHARKLNKLVLYEAGLEELVSAEDFASDTGMVQVIKDHPAQLFQVDEIGRLLKTIGDCHAGHLFNIATALLKLYSSADSTYKHKAYADSTNNISIKEPCVTLYGLTTPAIFYQGLTADSLADGFLARMMVLETRENPPRQRTGIGDVPEPILEAARWWGSYQPGGGNFAETYAHPALVPTDESAWAVFDALSERVDAESSHADTAAISLWARTEEKACRLALVYAASRNRGDVVVDAEAARWACELSTYTTQKMIHDVGHWVSENQFDARQKKVLRLLDKNGGSMTGRQLCRSTRSWTVRERSEAIENMVKTGQIVEEATTTRGRPRKTYHLPSTADRDADRT